MEFKKYNSIENTYRTAHLEKIQEYGLGGGDWVVTEKVHGANMSIWFDGTDFKFAKRTSFMGEGKRLKEDINWDNPAEKTDYYTHPIGKDNFNNWEEAMEADHVLRKVELIFKSLIPSGEGVLIVYGELFGGSYPHPDVVKSNMKCVQKGVFYSPRQHFYAFDIKVNGRFVDFFTFDVACRTNELFYAKALITGTLDECLAYPNDKQSLIYKWLDLPKLDEDNTSEGVVIKPIEPRYFPNGERVILKNKNEKFSEKQKRKKTKDPKPAKEFTPEAKAQFDFAMEYVNENRLRNVLSHIGGVTQKDFGKILGMFTKDVLEDYMKDHPEFMKLEASDRKLITKTLNRELGNFIRPNFLNIIDGVF